MNRMFPILSVLFCIFSPFLHCHGYAAITTDGSLKPATSLSGPYYTISPELGIQKGNNLFYSFGQFDISKNEFATFTGSGSISNIISRITGGHASTINGGIRCEIEGAAIWLLKPYGIIFGPNAGLYVMGSFHASTADYLQFSDGGIFYTNPSKTSSLTTAAPSAFGFLSNHPEEIRIDGTHLSVADGETLSLVGGDIEIIGGFLSSRSGKIQLASLASPGSATLKEDGLEIESSTLLGDIGISEKATISVIASIQSMTEGTRGGELYVYCNNYNQNGSRVFSFNYSPTEQGGNFLIDARESISLDQGSWMFNDTYNSGTGGNISLTTKNLVLQNASQITSSTCGVGNAGNMIVTAEKVKIDGGSESSLSQIGCSAEPGSSGDAGILYLNTRSLEVVNGGQLSSSTFGAGDGGGVIINADHIIVDGGIFSHTSNISSQTNSAATGDAGFIRIATDSLSLTNGGRITNGTFGTGNGGDIHITSKSILIDGTYTDQLGHLNSLISSASYTGATGNAGDTVIHADTLTISGGGAISTGTYENGSGGNLTITAKNILIKDGYIDDNSNFHDSIITSQTDGFGNAGDITIDTESLSLTNGGAIVSGTLGSGKGGEIRIDADTIGIEGGFLNLSEQYYSRISCQSEKEGNAGRIDLNTNALRLTNGGRIVAATYGNGDAGSITIAAKSILIDGVLNDENKAAASMITCQTENDGNAGDIHISADSLKLAHGGVVSANTYGRGNGGNITIQANAIMIEGGDTLQTDHSSSRIVCKAASGSAGRAGNIHLASGLLNISSGEISTTTSGLGLGGNPHSTPF
ncbi:filamentous hemagglutinin N-terminal domain-containing protein [Desulfatirhabdium butyrativorans]|uniref:two-partner secretion domain-containing protein n=1 Tax=Desulfatirhabdium butyrativorans TaxID=340467 RepID=UPI0004276687|nr:filamentous hemagglutinin N-terminal domain-containing protein [Desulfatirhabdium butyrativorans]